MKTRRFFMLALLAGTLAAIPASGGYLVDSSGAVVRNSYGECWRTGSWTPAQAIAECDPDLIRKGAPAARPAPVVEQPRPAPKPAPRMEAPMPAPRAGPALPPSSKAKNVGKKAAKKNGSYGLAELLVPYAATPAPSKGLLMVTSIHEHHWIPILHKGDETTGFAGFGMYTYVLFGSDPADPGLDSAIRARYDATLEAVLRQSLPESSYPSSAQTRGATNLFCLPANQRFVSRPKPDRETYDFPMAQQYLADFRFLLAGDKAILPRLVGDAGPFLIATLRPLGSIVKTEGGQMKIAEPQAPILFIALTHTHHQVIAEMVDAFKLEVIDTKLDRNKRFRPLRVALIDLLKKADDQVTPIREAVAGFMPKEEKKQEPPSKPVGR
ncbi:MAG TPA: hypothetical protein VMV75_04595 [Sulfuricella sp.]|nr:hypothetical protein [Sulfuricella sp.]